MILSEKFAAYSEEHKAEILNSVDEILDELVRTRSMHYNRLLEINTNYKTKDNSLFLNISYEMIIEDDGKGKGNIVDIKDLSEEEYYKAEELAKKDHNLTA